MLAVPDMAWLFPSLSDRVVTVAPAKARNRRTCGSGCVSAGAVHYNSGDLEGTYPLLQLRYACA